MGLIIKTLKLYFFLPQCRSIHFVSVDLFIRRDLLKKSIPFLLRTSKHKRPTTSKSKSNSAAWRKTMPSGRNRLRSCWTQREYVGAVNVWGVERRNHLLTPLFPPKASEYTRSLVDKKKEGSVVSSPAVSSSGQRRSMSDVCSR